MKPANPIPQSSLRKLQRECAEAIQEGEGDYPEWDSLTVITLINEIRLLKEEKQAVEEERNRYREILERVRDRANGVRGFLRTQRILVSPQLT